MTDKAVPTGLADLPLAERQRIEREQGIELRAALVRRHIEVMEGDQALAGANLAADVEMWATLNAHRARLTPVAPPVPIPVIAPETAPAEPDLRAQLGLK